MTNEGMNDPLRYGMERFHEQVSKMPPALEGYEYKPLNNFGRPILLVETGNDLIIEGTGLTARQLAVRDEVRLILSIMVLSMHEPFLKKRDERIRSLVILKDQVID